MAILRSPRLNPPKDGMITVGRTMKEHQNRSSTRGSRGSVLKVRIPPQPRFGKDVRQEVLEFANEFHIEREDLEQFIYAMGEAIANAIEHSASEEPIEIRCQVEGDKIIATVLDTGCGFETQVLDQQALPDEYSERGRGLPIMQSFTHIFAVRSAPGEGTTVVLGRYLRKPEHRPYERRAEA